jgi:hypothetical protein
MCLTLVLTSTNEIDFKRNGRKINKGSKHMWTKYLRMANAKKKVFQLLTFTTPIKLKLNCLAQSNKNGTMKKELPTSTT